MSCSKQANTNVEETDNLPITKDRHDRFCTNCGKVIKNLALEKHEGIKCDFCNREVEYVSTSDGIYRDCVRCMAPTRCTHLFCKMCGRRNAFCDRDKPARKEAAQKAQLRHQILAEIEASSLSQTCIEDDQHDQSSFGQSSEVSQDKDANSISKDVSEDISQL